MIPEIGTGIQDFEKICLSQCFYVDKTDFVREWWMGNDDVTLITRPRRFGKTLNMSTLNCFFSNKYAGRSELFEGLKVWDDPAMREEQGQWPVIFLTFAGVKAIKFEDALDLIKRQLSEIALSLSFLRSSDCLENEEKEVLSTLFRHQMSNTDAVYALKNLSGYLFKHFARKVLIFLDEYDTPLQEAWSGGYWDEMVSFIRTLFNNTFKTNSSLARAVMTGITRVSMESIFSDLNNLKVVTTTSDQYATCFGFTEQEVFTAMDERGFSEEDKKMVKKWYDGFTFGQVTDIYNPWSLTNFFDDRKLNAYWTNSSSNELVSRLLRQGTPEIKTRFEDLLMGRPIVAQIDEQIIFDQLDEDSEAVWSLMLATGYLKIVAHQSLPEASESREDPKYTLALTNLEVRQMFDKMFRGWFGKGTKLSRFTAALLQGDVRGLEIFLNEMMLKTMSAFDGGNNPSVRLPENFYHGLVLGLLAENAGEYLLQSNRESGYGRYDVIMQPQKPGRPAVIMEFKVFDGENEKGLDDTAARALIQIEEKKYDTALLALGVPAPEILKYAFAFRGKEVLIREILREGNFFVSTEWHSYPAVFNPEFLFPNAQQGKAESIENKIRCALAKF